MRSRYSTLAAAVALALGSSAAGAAGVDDIFSIRGYGTVGGLYSSEDKADYVRDMLRPARRRRLLGRSELCGRQQDGHSARREVHGALLGRHPVGVRSACTTIHGTTSPKRCGIPSLEWANLSYRVTDNFTVRGGRIVMPFLMSAEYQKVGYANHWMRSPDRSVRQGVLQQRRRRRYDVQARHRFGQEHDPRLRRPAESPARRAAGLLERRHVRLHRYV